MSCCVKARNEDEDEEQTQEEQISKAELEAIMFKSMSPSVSYPKVNNLRHSVYVRYLENQYNLLLNSYFNVSTEMARLQSTVSQLITGSPSERNAIIEDLKLKNDEVLGGENQRYMFPTLEEHSAEMGDICRKQQMLIVSVRRQIGSLRKASEWLPVDGAIGAKISPTAVESPECSKINFMNESTESYETCGSVGEEIISARSSTFKELRDIYQKASMDASKICHQG